MFFGHFSCFWWKRYRVWKYWVNGHSGSKKGRFWVYFWVKVCVSDMGQIWGPDQRQIPRKGVKKGLKWDSETSKTLHLVGKRHFSTFCFVFPY